MCLTNLWVVKHPATMTVSDIITSLLRCFPQCRAQQMVPLPWKRIMSKRMQPLNARPKCMPAGRAAKFPSSARAIPRVRQASLVICQAYCLVATGHSMPFQEGELWFSSPFDPHMNWPLLGKAIALVHKSYGMYSSAAGHKV